MFVCYKDTEARIIALPSGDVAMPPDVGSDLSPRVGAFVFGVAPPPRIPTSARGAPTRGSRRAEPTAIKGVPVHCDAAVLEARTC